MCVINYRVYTVCAHAKEEKIEKCQIESLKQLIKGCKKNKSVTLVIGWCPTCISKITEAYSSPSAAFSSVNFRTEGLLRQYWAYKARLMQQSKNFTNERVVVPPIDTVKMTDNAHVAAYEARALKATIKAIDPAVVGLQHGRGLQLARGEKETEAIVRDAIGKTWDWVGKV